MDSYYAWTALKRESLLYLGIVTKYKNDKVAGEMCDRRHFFFCHYWENSKRKYNFYPYSYSWAEAFEFCKNDSQYLAIFGDWDHLPSEDKEDFPVWTGLYHDGVSWKWSDGTYSNIWKSHPDFESSSNNVSGLCGAVWSQSKTMTVHNCSETLPYLCYFSVSVDNVVLVKEKLTWEEAVEGCKAVSSSQLNQLLSVELSDLSLANSKALDAETDKVWLGLRFLGGSWFWSNGETVTLPGLPSCPDPKLACGALLVDKSATGLEPKLIVEPTDCRTARLQFLHTHSSSSEEIPRHSQWDIPGEPHQQGGFLQEAFGTQYTSSLVISQSS
ncbi:hypothetical protein WMY93_012173 [Mugilogobius chulae]|uniref:C-type lectin domain-containing protein n=1 Tax=Mugilogobius chulae TaxID=88201 RepID=A0AAW0P862_9GOBI